MLNIALKQAKKSNFERAPTGAVITKGGRIIATGINQVNTYTKVIDKKFKRWDSSCHAEADAIGKLLNKHRFNDLAGSTIYVIRTLPSGKIGMSKPCKHCKDLIKSVGIKKIVYINEDGDTIIERIRE